MADTPEFLLPFQFLPFGGAEEIEQGSDTEKQQSVYAILAYQPGQRTDLPNFGLPDQSFLEGGADLNQIEAIITEWDPRVRESISRDPNWLLTTIDTISARIDNG